MEWNIFPSRHYQILLKLNHRRPFEDSLYTAASGWHLTSENVRISYERAIGVGSQARFIKARHIATLPFKTEAKSVDSWFGVVADKLAVQAETCHARKDEWHYGLR
jgi:hypothetical protein